MEVKLPPKAFLRTIFRDNIPPACAFTLWGADHAIRFAVSTHAIIQGALLPKSEPQPSFLFDLNLAWLLDCYQPLVALLSVWPTPLDVNAASVIQLLLDTGTAIRSSKFAGSTLSQKASIALVLACSGAIQSPRVFLSEDEAGETLRRAMCLVIRQLAKDALIHRPVLRLIEFQIINPIQALQSENAIIAADTDVGVGTSLNVRAEYELTRNL